MAIFSSLIFKLNDFPDEPDKNLEPFQMVAGQASISIIIMIVVYNRKLKEHVWDDVKKKVKNTRKVRSIPFSSYVNCL